MHGSAGEGEGHVVTPNLPDFPWDRLAEIKQRAAAHPDGVVDLSVGTPVDSTPAVVQQALTAARDAPGYPTTHGTVQLRETIAEYLRVRAGAEVESTDAILPTIGSKELVAWLPTLLGLGPGDRVVIPELAYPTYAVGATLAGCEAVPADSTTALGPGRVGMVWLNSPSNPTGRIQPAEHLAKVVAWARERGAVVVSDECYLEYAWEGEPVSVLHPDVCGSSHDGVLAVHSLSKRSNLAGYRAGFVTGDPQIVAKLLHIRKHAGMIMPWPVQEAMRAALGDFDHVTEQRERYRQRRTLLRQALDGANFDIEHSEGALYLWATRGHDSWKTVRELAELGILATPGDFYGTAGGRHVRVAFTATDERVAAAVSRLAAS